MLSKTTKRKTAPSVTSGAVQAIYGWTLVKI